MIVPGQDDCFDEATTMAMGVAFDRACGSLRSFGTASTVREIIAKRIIEVARQGERDPARLHYHALKAFDVEETSDVLAA
jgi:hypothetical protein